MFSIEDLPPRWTKEVATFRRRGQDDLALFLESYLAELEAEMIAEGHAVAAKAGDEMQTDYTVAQIAEMFDRKSQTIRDWIKSGELRGYLFKDREYRITGAALEEFQEEQRTGAEPAKPTEEPELGAWRGVCTNGEHPA